MCKKRTNKKKPSQEGYELDKTTEPMNMHDRVTRESSGIPSF